MKCRRTITTRPISTLYIGSTGVRDAGKSPLFRTVTGRTGALTDTPMHRVVAWRMVQRWAVGLRFWVNFGCHTFRAPGITAYLEAGGNPENALASQESPRRTKLYDRTGDEITLTRSTASRSSEGLRGKCLNLFGKSLLGLAGS